MPPRPDRSDDWTCPGKHDKRFHYGQINEEDVGETVCVACIPLDNLTPLGRKLRRRVENLLVNERNR